MPIHRLYQNGRLFDEMDSKWYNTIQIAQSYANQYTGNTFVLKDENEAVIYECKITITPKQQLKAK
jgi:hypothetical protein